MAQAVAARCVLQCSHKLTPLCTNPKQEPSVALLGRATRVLHVHHTAQNQVKHKQFHWLRLLFLASRQSATDSATGVQQMAQQMTQQMAQQIAKNAYKSAVCARWSSVRGPSDGATDVSILVVRRHTLRLPSLCDSTSPLSRSR